MYVPTSNRIPVEVGQEPTIKFQNIQSAKVESTNLKYHSTKLFEEKSGRCYVRGITKIQDNENHFHYKEYLRRRFQKPR